MAKPKVIFNDDARILVLEAVGIRLDTEDYLVFMENGERVRDQLGEYVKFEEFAGIYRNNIIKGDLFSIMQLAELARDSDEEEA